MAYTYKTIGNTTAAVVSLLAVGTLCWWQRTPGPINAPRPQDEAEIMTAVLERHYAMGRTNTQFTQAKPAYVSQVPDTNAAGGVRYVTNSAALTLTNTIGFFPQASSSFPQGVRTAFINGGFTSINYHGLRPYYDEGSYQMGGFVDWWSYGSVNIYSPPMGQYSADKSSDPLKFAAPWCDAGWNTLTGWIVPENAFMDSGDLTWFGSVIHSNVFTAPLEMWLGWGEDFYLWTKDDFANQIASRSMYVWTNYIALPVSHFTTTTNYSYEVITNRVIGGVTNTITNTYNTTTGYVSTASVNTFIHPTSMRFAFERDSKPYMWSTNVYRDMGRALSLLQWIRDLAQPRTNISWTIDYTNGIFKASSSSTNYSVANPIVTTSYSVGGGGITNSRASGTVVQYDFANALPFNVDTVLFQSLSSVLTNLPASYTNGPPSISSVTTGAVGSSGWWPVDPSAIRTLLDDFARTNRGGSMYLSMSIPYDCYHVQFTALTNYLDHAPAR